MRALKGTHLVVQGRQVRIGNVTVVPQPVGSYLALVHENDVLAPIAAEGRLLVFNPGFFSLDWSVLVEGQLVHTITTGSSL